MWLISLASAAQISVTDVAGLQYAVDAAAPGDTIVLAAGTYRLESTLHLDNAGSSTAPITLRGEGATIESDTVEALKISAPYWHIEDLDFKGVCATDDDCEHALHIVGAADGTEVRGCTLVDFNAQIKGNGEDLGAGYVYPDDVVIEGNDFHDTRPRQTSNSVTKIDVVGGRRWRVEANRISDYEKGGGDGVSYGAFLKGHSQDGVFERNLVVCSENFEGGTRIGLSLGGGGTSPDSICEEGTCTPEHERGTLRNNIIANCSDVGIYLNKGEDSVIEANTLYRTSGIDVRYEASAAWLGNNVLDGKIRERDGGTATQEGNWTELALADVFTDPDGLDFSLKQDPGLVNCSGPLDGPVDDFCGAPRDGEPDCGALEYADGVSCDTTRTWPTSGGGDDNGGDDSGGDDSGGEDSAQDSGGQDEGGEGCGCAAAAGPGGLGLPLLLGLALARRRSSRARAGHPG